MSTMPGNIANQSFLPCSNFTLSKYYWWIEVIHKSMHQPYTTHHKTDTRNTALNQTFQKNILHWYIPRDQLKHVNKYFNRFHRCLMKNIDWNGMKWSHPAQPPRASLLVASCKISTSTPSGGSSTYRTTDPLIKQFFTDSICGYLSCSTTLVFSNLMLRYWSTECRVPLMAKSFFNSTVTSFPTNSLKYEKNNMLAWSAATQTKIRKTQKKYARQNSKLFFFRPRLYSKATLNLL